VAILLLDKKQESVFSHTKTILRPTRDQWRHVTRTNQIDLSCNCFSSICTSDELTLFTIFDELTIDELTFDELTFDELNFDELTQHLYY